MDIENDVVILMSATINPRAMNDVSRTNPRDREEDYAKSLAYYIKRVPRFRRIVFIENSGACLDRLREVAKDNPHGKEVEFISLSCNDFPIGLGKSYGEMLLLDEGTKASRLAQQARYYLKLTGRAFLLNLTKLVERIPEPVELICDNRDHPLYEWLHLKAHARHADTRFFLCTRRYYDEHIRGTYARCNDAANDATYYRVENLFYDFLKAGGPGVYPRLPIEPIYAGLAGHGGKDYGSCTERVKRRIRAFLRAIAPWFHI